MARIVLAAYNNDRMSIDLKQFVDGFWHNSGFYPTKVSHLFNHPVLEELFQTTVPPHLAHYTTVHGLAGIAESGTLWASDTLFLNDEVEIRYFWDIMTRALQQLADPGVDEFEEIRSILDRHLTPTSSHFFVTSFSEHEDQLSQWRGYANGGYSIGFPRDTIVSTASAERLILVKCCYDKDLASRIAAEMLRSFVLNFGETSGRNWATDPILRQFRDVLKFLAVYFKHPAFAEEGEWRLVKGLRHKSMNQPDRRVVGKGFVPFFKLPIFEHMKKREETDNHSMDGLRVFCSPGNDHGGEVSFVFNKHQHVWAGVHVSQIPYRTAPLG